MTDQTHMCSDILYMMINQQRYIYIYIYILERQREREREREKERR